MRSDMRVDLPEGKLGKVEIQKFTVPRSSVEGWRLAMRGRGVVPGDYTRLLRNGQLWMSDTTAEQNDHWEPAREIAQRGGRILIVGLGLGMIVKAALSNPNVKHVDVVEIDPDVVGLVGPHYTKDPRVTIHLADAYTITWPPGTRWSYAWFDIWPDLCADYLPEMAKLARSYGRRCDATGFWGKPEMLAQRRREQTDFHTVYGWRR